MGPNPKKPRHPSRLKTHQSPHKSLQHFNFKIVDWNRLWHAVFNQLDICLSNKFNSMLSFKVDHLPDFEFLSNLRKLLCKMDYFLACHTMTHSSRDLTLRIVRPFFFHRRRLFLQLFFNRSRCFLHMPYLLLEQSFCCFHCFLLGSNVILKLKWVVLIQQLVER